MTDSQFADLAGRIDGVGRVLAMLIADLEIRENLDGERFCRQLRGYAQGRARHLGLDYSANLIGEIADEIDAARKNRAEARQSQNRE